MSSSRISFQKSSVSYQTPSTQTSSWISTGAYAGLPGRRAISVVGEGSTRGRLATPGIGQSSLIRTNYVGGLGTAAPGAFRGNFVGSLVSGIGGGIGACFSGDFANNIFTGSEKQTMQNLNDRLANYLKKVHSLEVENGELEKKIREWHMSKSPATHHDYSSFNETIADLQKKIQDATVENAEILVNLDNAKLATDDFRTKYENELTFRQGVDADIAGMRRMLDDLTLCRSDLEMQIEGLKDELDNLNKTHEEDMKSMSTQLSGQVSVEVDAVPGVDLTRSLEEMRSQYDGMVEKNRREAKEWFDNKSIELNKEVTTSTETLQIQKTEITDLRRTLQGLEIELQSQLSMRNGLQSNLAETESRYGTQLQQIQAIIHETEAQLTNLRAQLEGQATEYKLLLDIKAHLEQEINTYRHLLEGEENRNSGSKVTMIKEKTGSIIKN
ncbi:keratin, type I cytoskeletal 19-like [Protopterus annectens]|uniref:keratin, type I cytoskeletal 19-like n=1 Tax=Protopterus annectens TaxID=7888 RepID=UPI001CF93FF3|nr:keratin, type I cytoskeletal 19-like [Protopterus annectens]